MVFQLIVNPIVVNYFICLMLFLVSCNIDHIKCSDYLALFDHVYKKCLRKRRLVQISEFDYNFEFRSENSFDVNCSVFGFLSETIW